MLKQTALSALFVGTAVLGFAPVAQAEDASETVRKLWVGPTAAEIRGEEAHQVPLQRADATPKFSVQSSWNGDLNYGQSREDIVRDSATVASASPVEFGTFLHDLYTGAVGDPADTRIASKAERKEDGTAAGAK